LWIASLCSQYLLKEKRRNWIASCARKDDVSDAGDEKLLGCHGLRLAKTLKPFGFRLIVKLRLCEVRSNPETSSSVVVFCIVIHRLCEAQAEAIHVIVFVLFVFARHEAIQFCCRHHPSVVFARRKPKQSRRIIAEFINELRTTKVLHSLVILYMYLVNTRF